MTKRKPNLKFVLAAFVAGGAVLLLLRLGFWQVERLQWKQDLLQKIQAEQSVDPTQVPLGTLVNDVQGEYRRGYLTGVWANDKNVRVGPHQVDGVLGYWIVTPFVLNGGQVVMVNRGWVAESMTTMVQESAPPVGIITITGTLRPADPEGTMAGDNRSWHGLNAPAIARSLKVESPARYVLFMEKSTPPDESTLKPAPVVPHLRNEHLNYAIFWFGMALLVVVVFVLASLPERHSA